MKKIVSAVTGLMTIAVCSGVAAQDAPVSNPVDLFTCDFREGKGRADLAAVAKKFAKWSKKNDKDYSAWLMYPQVRAVEDGFDVAWLGAWSSGATMGKGMDAYLTGDHGLGGEFDKVIDCSDGHSMVVSYPIHTENWSTSDGNVWFSSCTLADGKTGQDAMAAHKKMADMMVAKGSKSSTWLFWPTFGWGEIEHDYYNVVAHPNYAELGANWDRYFSGDTMQQASAIMDGVASCDSARIYDTTLVVEGVINR